MPIQGTDRACLFLSIYDYRSNAACVRIEHQSFHLFGRESPLPKDVRALRNSFLSILPLLSSSKPRKTFSHSVMKCHNERNSAKLIVEELSASNIPIIIRTVSWNESIKGVCESFDEKRLTGLKGLHVPLESADWSSFDVIEPDPSASTLQKEWPVWLRRRGDHVLAEDLLQEGVCCFNFSHVEEMHKGVLF